MLKRSLKVLIAIVLSLMFTVSLVKIVLLIWSSHPDYWLLLQPSSSLYGGDSTLDGLPSSTFTADEWEAYQQLFSDKEGKWKAPYKQSHL